MATTAVKNNEIISYVILTIALLLAFNVVRGYFTITLALAGLVLVYFKIGLPGLAAAFIFFSGSLFGIIKIQTNISVSICIIVLLPLLALIPICCRRRLNLLYDSKYLPVFIGWFGVFIMLLII